MRFVWAGFSLLLCSLKQLLVAWDGANHLLQHCITLVVPPSIGDALNVVKHCTEVLGSSSALCSKIKLAVRPLGLCQGKDSKREKRAQALINCRRSLIWPSMAVVGG